MSRIPAAVHLRRKIGMLAESAKCFLQGRPKASSAILVAGGPRSGTTWLADILSASPGSQQIFEPLNPGWIKEVRALTGRGPKRPYMLSFYLRASRAYPEWSALLERVLTGQIRSYWTDPYRSSYFPDRYVIKLIRANLMLGYLYDRFQPRIVYIVRHPCATIHSRMALGWHADVADILAQQELVEDYLQPWVGAIEKERDLLGAHAVWWAVENLVATSELATRPHHLVTFESLCLKPQQVVGRIFAWLGVAVPAKLPALIERPSRVSRPEVHYESALQQLSLWRQQLTSSEQYRILEWAHRLGVSLYDDQIYPASLQT